MRYVRGSRKVIQVAVYYCFHYERDSQRVQQILNMGVVEGQPVLNSQAWEKIKEKGDSAIEKWIDEQMKYKTAVVVLIGTKTDTREWVLYEIKKAWNEKRPLLGIRIHGLADLTGATGSLGGNPFAKVDLQNGKTAAASVPIFSPRGSDSKAIYADIKSNLKSWVEQGYKRA